jgi:hypothetical protein
MEREEGALDWEGFDQSGQLVVRTHKKIRVFEP